METSTLSFAHSLWLLSLWLLPLVLLVFWWAEQRRRLMIGRLVAPKLRRLLAGSASSGRRWFRVACLVGALGLLILALAGPRMGYDSTEVPHRGRDVIIAMDVSRSMLAADVAPTRLQRSKLLVEDLIRELSSDRIGLIAFAGSAFLQAPLTLDHGAVLSAAAELDTRLIPKGGSNLAVAIGTAEEAFGKAEGFSRALIIISDGEELDTDGLTAAKEAAAKGIRIFTVGIGSVEGSEIPLGPGKFVRDASGKIVQSRLDARRLTEIAEITGGFYTPLDAGTTRVLVANGIGKMEETELATTTSRRPIERYQWPLGGAIVLLFLQALVGERRREGAVTVACWILGASLSWSAPAGLEAYDEGDYEQAQLVFERRLALEPAAAGLQLNAGTAAYQLKDYDKASQYFSRAMLADDSTVRAAAEFNLGNTLFRQGEGQEDKAKRMEDWKDALAKYEASLKTQPDYPEARENKDRVEKLLQELEQEQEEQEQEEQEQKEQEPEEQEPEDEPEDEQEPEDEESEDEPSPEGEDDQPSSGGENEENEESPEDGDEGEDQGGEEGETEPDRPEDEGSQDGENGENGEQDEPPNESQGEPEQEGPGKSPENSEDEAPRNPSDTPPPTDPSEEKKEGELRSTQQGSSAEAGDREELAAGEEETEGQMSEAQARALLRSLQGEEEQVDLLERGNFQEVLRNW